MQRMRHHVYAALLIILIGVIIYFSVGLLNVLSVPVGIILWTIILVFCMKGPVNWFEKKGIKRALGTLLTFVLFIGSIVLMVLIAASPVFDLGEQFINLLENASKYLAALGNWFNGIYAQYAYLLQDQSLDKWFNDVLSSLGTWLSSFAQQSAQGVVAFGSGVGSAVMVIGFALVVSYWVLLELPQLGREAKRVVGPKHAEDLNVIYLICNDVMGGYIKGTLIQCVLIGVCCGVGFAIMGIPSAAALGVITGILNVIPVVGPWLGGAMAAIVGVFVSPWIGLIALAYTIIVQQAIYTFVSPKVMGNQVNIHPALVILALMTGSALGFAMSGLMGSFVGALLAIPAVAAIKALFVYYFEKSTGRTIVASDGVLFKGEPVNEKVAHPIVDATGDATGEFRLPKKPKHPSEGAHSSKS